MTTYYGEKVSLDVGSPSIRSIGVSLGRIPRFCGHLQKWYPVLCHSLVVAAIMPEHLGIYGMMHDSQESLFSDVPTPMKSEVARNREAKVQKRIYIANGIPAPSEEAIEALEDADHLALVAEAIVLGHPGSWGTEYDAEAGRLTKHYAKKALVFIDADYSANFFERKFKEYMKKAGLVTPEWE